MKWNTLQEEFEESADESPLETEPMVEINVFFDEPHLEVLRDLFEEALEKRADKQSENKRETKNGDDTEEIWKHIGPRIP